MNQMLNSKYILILLSVHLFFFILMWAPHVGSDGLEFYAWVYSPIVDRDLDFSSGELPGFIPLDLKTPTGLSHNLQNAGSSLMNAPFLLVAYFVSLLFGYSYDEFQNPSILTAAYNLGTVVYSFFGSWILFQVLTNLHFKKTDSMITVLIIVLATPLVHYVFQEPSFSHTQTFFVVSLFLLIWVKLREENSVKYWVYMGLCVGLIFLIRLVDAIFIIFPILFIILFKRKELKKFPTTYVKFALYLGCFILAFSPMMVFWNVLYGDPLPNPLPVEQLYAQGGDPDKKFMDFQHPHFFEFFFSDFRGLFIWHPVFILFLVGYYFLFKKHRELAILSIVITSLVFYLHAAPFDWWAGGSFGQRRTADILPFLALGLVALFDAIKAGSLKSKIIKPLIFGSFIISNLIIMSLWNKEKLITFSGQNLNFVDNVLLNIVNWQSYLLHQIQWSPILRYITTTKDYGFNIDQIGWLAILSIPSIVLLLLAFKEDIKNKLKIKTSFK